MVQRLKQAAQLAATLLVTVVGTGTGASAMEPQDIKAGLLADIAFEYAELKDAERLSTVLDQALSSTKAMQFKCFQANPLSKIAGSYLLVGQTSQGQPLLAEAVEVAKAQEATGCSSSATSPTESLSYRAREYAEAGHLDLAVELSTELGDPIIQANLAGRLAEAGQRDRANDLLDQAIALAKSIDDQYYQTQTLVVMARQLRLAGHTESVSRVLEQARGSSALARADTQDAASLQISSMIQIAEELAAVDADQSAIAVLDQTVPKIQALLSQSSQLDAVVYQVEAALEYDALGQESRAVALLAEARGTAQALASDSVRSQENALGRVAEGYARLGDFEQALQIARSIQSQVEREIAFQRIALTSARADDIEGAVALAESNGSRRNATLIEITRHFLSNQQPDLAWEFVQTQQVKGIVGEVAVGFLEAGQPEQALQIAQSNGLEGFVPDVAQAYVDTGRPDQALQLVDNQQMEWLLPAIARGFAEQNQLEMALEVAHSIGDSVYRAQALIAIAQAYRSQNLATSESLPGMLANFFDFTRGLVGDSDREKVTEVLEQALEVVQSL